MHRTALLVATLALGALAATAAHAAPAFATAAADHSFGYGVWRDDADCDYSTPYGGPTVQGHDPILGPARFVLGEDDQNGPVKIGDPSTGFACVTSGIISPCDVVCDAAGDPDDCLSPVYLGVGSVCGTGGGDGMAHAFCLAFLVNPPGGYVHRPCPNTVWW